MQTGDKNAFEGLSCGGKNGCNVGRCEKNKWNGNRTLKPHFLNYDKGATNFCHEDSFSFGAFRYELNFGIEPFDQRWRGSLNYRSQSTETKKDRLSDVDSASGITFLSCSLKDFENKKAFEGKGQRILRTAYSMKMKLVSKKSSSGIKLVRR